MQNRNQNLHSFASMTALFVAVSGLSACGLQSSGKYGGKAQARVPIPQTVLFDGVKLVSSSIADPNDPSTMTQPRYSISSRSRLLLRFEKFASRKGEVWVDTDKPVTVDLYMNTTAEAFAAQSAFTLCPLVKTWMMLATWQQGYPMGSSGTWKKPGGDFDASECAHASAPDGVRLNFDVTPWFSNDVMLRNLNHGLVLMSAAAQALVVRGDTDTSMAPRMNWMK